MFRTNLYPYMAPKGDDGEDLSGGDLPEDDAALAALRGDDLGEEEVVEEKDEAKEKEEEKEEVERDEKGRFKGKEKEEEKEKDEKAEEEKEKDEEEKDEEEKDEEEEEPPQGKKQPSSIPKARFDELNRKSRERITQLEGRIEELTKGAQKEAEKKEVEKAESIIERLEGELEALLTDGKNKEAAQKMREIRVLERDLVTSRAAAISERDRAMAVEQVRFDSLVDSLEAEYAELNPDSADYNEEMLQEVMFLRSSFEKNGLSSSQALSQAVKYVFVNRVAREDEASRDKGGKKGLRDGDKPKEEDRKKQAVKRNVDAAKKIPAKQEGGVDSDKKGGGITEEDIGKMSEEEFEALPEATKARMRGDFL